MRKAILAVAAAGLIGLATAATPASAQRFGHGGVHMGGAHFGGGFAGPRFGGRHWGGGFAGPRFGGGHWGGARWGGGHWRGPGWGLAGVGLGLGLATAPLWAAPYYYNDYYPAYAYDPCWRRVWWRGAWHLRRVCW